jgi:hypothetical protein
MMQLSFQMAYFKQYQVWFSNSHYL